MPEPRFTDADFDNPDAPDDDRRLRADHPRVRDLSYDRSRSRQMLDLYKRSFFDPGHPDDEAVQAAEKSGVWPSRLEIYIKESHASGGAPAGV